MKRILFALLLCVSTSAFSSSAQLSFAFSQSGFADGGEVTGEFQGIDLDGDGQLSSFTGEISGFYMYFSGNSIVESFSLDFEDLYGLVYDLDFGPLGDGFSLDVEGIGAESGTNRYMVGPGPMEQCGQQADCAVVTDEQGEDYSQELVRVSMLPTSPVPLSPGMLIIMTMLLGVAGVRFMKRSL